MIARKVVLALVLLKSVLQLNLASYLSCFDHAMEQRGGEGAVFENGEEERLRWQLERWFSNVLAEDFPFSTKGRKLLSFSSLCFCIDASGILLHVMLAGDVPYQTNEDICRGDTTTFRFLWINKNNKK